MSYIGKNPEADSVKLKGSAAEPSGASVDGQVYFNTGTGSISKGMKVYKNSQFVAIDKQLGDADTMQLLKAADIPAIDFSLSLTSTTVGGNNAVPFEGTSGDFDGTAAFTNSSTGDALLTDDSDDLVFHYTTQATNNADNDFWGIPLTIPRAFRGGNLVLEFKYRTEIATGTMDDGYFNIALQDRSAMILQTQASTISAGAISAGSNVLLTAKTYTNPVTSTSLTVAVGDRVFVESGTGTAGSQDNDIVDCFITEVSSTDNNVKLSEDIVAVQSGKFVTGWLTGYNTGGQIDAFASDTNKDGTSKKLAFKTDADTQQVSLWFFVKGTSTVKHELFFDNILLSGNKFLQIDTKLKTHSYTAAKGTGWWLSSTGTAWSSGASRRWNPAKLVAGPDTPDYSNSPYFTVENITLGGGDTVTAIKAKKKIRISATFGNDTAVNETVFIYKGDNSNPVGAQQNRGANDNSTMADVDVVLEIGEYIHAKTSGGSYDTGWTTMVITAIDSPAVALESQDEIFTDTVEYTPTWAGLGTVSNNKATWSRVGDKMHIMGSVTAGTQSGLISFTLPSGYNIDGSKLGREQNTSNTGQSVGHAGQQGGVGRTFLVLANTLTATDKLYFGGGSTGTDIAVPSTSMGSTDNLTFFATVPIVGWNSNFNPLLSMPLVDFGSFENTFTAYITSGGDISSQSGGGNDWLASCTNSTGSYTLTYTSGFFTVAPSVNVTCDSTTNHGRIGQVVSYSSTGSVCSSTNASSGAQTNNDVQGIFVSVTRQGTDYKMPPQPTAAVIKPAVATITNTQSYNAQEGQFGGSNAWVDRVLNTMKGETWFIDSLSSNTFTLQAGTYKVIASAPGYYINNNRIRLYNTTLSKTQINGQVDYAASTYNGSSRTRIEGSFVITSACGFKIQHINENNYANNNALGNNSAAPSNGGNAIFTSVVIEKLK
jgi:hypothetical protein